VQDISKVDDCKFAKEKSPDFIFFKDGVIGYSVSGEGAESSELNTARKKLSHHYRNI
jgi:hypothetical protein